MLKRFSVITLMLMVAANIAMTCDDDIPLHPVYLVNKSGDDIYYIHDSEPFTVREGLYKLPNYGIVLHVLHDGEVDESLHTADVSRPGNVLYLMIFHKETWQSHSRAELAEKEYCDTLIRITYQELVAKEYRIEYTGNNVKQNETDKK